MSEISVFIEGHWAFIKNGSNKTEYLFGDRVTGIPLEPGAELSNYFTLNEIDWLKENFSWQAKESNHES